MIQVYDGDGIKPGPIKLGPSPLILSEAQDACLPTAEECHDLTVVHERLKHIASPLRAALYPYVYPFHAFNHIETSKTNHLRLSDALSAETHHGNDHDIIAAFELRLRVALHHYTRLVKDVS